MANEKLENLLKIRQLKAEPATKEEVAGLLRSGALRLADAKNENLSKQSLKSKGHYHGKTEPAKDGKQALNSDND